MTPIYFILTTARSGCTYFQELIRSVKVLGWPNTALERIDWTCEMIEKMRRRAEQRGVPLGLKLPHQTRERIMEWLEPDCLIHYYRRDLVRQAISHVRAMQTKCWIRRSYHRLPRPKDLDRLTYRFRAILGAAQQIRSIHRNIMEYPIDATFVYEDVCADPAGSVRRLAELLGVEFPVNTQPTTSMVIQRDELTEQWYKRFCDELQSKEEFARFVPLLGVHVPKKRRSVPLSGVQKRDAREIRDAGVPRGQNH